jgi:hypothetical protein
MITIRQQVTIRGTPWRTKAALQLLRLPEE